MPYKRGFTNIYKTPWEVVNLGRLDALQVEGPVTPEVLLAQGVIRGLRFPVKILAGGELTRSMVIHAHAFSDAARAAIEQLGGSVTELDRTDEWVHARPRSRRLPLNRELKRARVGKVGGPTRREAIAALAERQEG
jgi:large subunit ribosomal protein L15